MKKIIAFCIILVAGAGLVHISFPQYGGLPGVWHRSQARAVTYLVQLIKDPGACSYIRGYWGRSIHEKLRDRCVKTYVLKTVKEKGDCRVESLPHDITTLSNLSLKEEYRYTCLLQHYQNMLGNSLTQEWLPEKCLRARDQLVEMNHYCAIIRNARAARITPDFSGLSTMPDLSVVVECEKMLDAPKIYGFLRKRTLDYIGFTPEERLYINEQRTKMLEGQTTSGEPK